MIDIIEKINRVALPGTVIPKPRTKEHLVKEWSISAGERALVYTMPNKNNPDKLDSKLIKESDFRKSYYQLTTYGTFTKQWLKLNLPVLAKQGCNFTTIGGIFELLG